MRTELANTESFAPAPSHEPSIEDCKEQVRRVSQSAAFRNTATLQLLLQFLTDKTLSGSAEFLKEYTIGVEALSRKPDFDPKIDPIVRVQCHRLRVKLKEYYETDGYRDPILIQFPKGHYVPTFETMPVSPLVLTEEPVADIVDEETPKPDETDGKQGLSNKWRHVGIVGLTIALVALGFWLGGLRAHKQLNAAKAIAPVINQGMVESFWLRFLGADTAPVIAYTDAVFLLDDSNDLFRFRRGAIDSRGALVDPHVAHDFASNPGIVAQAGPLYYENGYTGTGELESIAMLAGLFGRMGIRPIIKSSRDVTPDDLNQHNIILLGSPFQNAAVAQLLTLGDFSYSNPDGHHEQWRAQILNAHPRPGEASTYGTERDTQSKVLTADSSLITITPGMVPGRWIAVVGGLDTKGTEGAVMFATSKHGIERLNKILDGFGSGNNEMVPFQALVRVHLAKGYQVLGTDLVAVHPIQSEKADAPPATPTAH